MDEGKPTKAKWWSLPRPQSSSARQSPADRVDDSTAEPSSHAPDPADGDFELARPNPAASLMDAPGEPAAMPGPAATVPAAAPASVVDDGNGDGDYELSRPATRPEAGVAQDPEGPGLPADLRDLDDTGGAEDTGGAGSAAIPGARGPGDEAEAVSAADADADAVSDAGADAEAVAAVGPIGPVVVEERRGGPLHDPDPYSTPPYGEPGPWAPAPPVQHPAAAAVPVPPPGGAVPAPGADVTPLAAGHPAGPDRQPDAGLLAPPAPAPAPSPSAPPLPSPSPEPPATAASSPAPSPSSPSSPSFSSSSPAVPWQRYDPWSAAPFGGSAGAEPVGEAQRSRQARGRLVGGALVVALVSGGLGGAVGTYLERNGGLRPIQLPQASAEPTGRAADGVAGIAARALPGVVTLHVGGGDASGTGTGFVLDPRGYILTNNHVVESAESGGTISVVFDGGQTVGAEVVGRDSGYDLAVVRVTGVKGLKPLYLGNSDDVRVGDPVVAIGAPFDLEGTVTSGIISARERPVIADGGSGDASDVSYVDALQTDAPINPGNSGGPLLDARGRVIGVNSAIRSGADGADTADDQGGSIGLGFAIPINLGKRVAEELINTGRATHPVIGVSLDMDYAGDGALVSATGADGNDPVTPDGPGDRAGIRAGDVITEVDGRRVHTGGELIVRTRAHRPGDRLELTVERAGRERTLTLVLGSSGDG
ncbi:S1C family serine protease [Streptomyces hayashii]|uniref:S1C family serine protease n=1 Tax=Streptomyces hayashii TaxID=2839966 RepID=UPI00403CF50E